MDSFFYFCFMAKMKNERNAGRKPKYGEPTKVVSFKLPISKIPELKERFYLILKEYEQKKDSD